MLTRSFFSLATPTVPTVSEVVSPMEVASLTADQWEAAHRSVHILILVPFLSVP